MRTVARGKGEILEKNEENQLKNAILFGIEKITLLKRHGMAFEGIKYEECYRAMVESRF